MLCPTTLTKFVGTISLGLLTGISYNTSAITLPSLALLPTAALASDTLAQIQASTTRQVLTFASISSLSLVTGFGLASPRGRHPYLLWTALMALLAGQGVEYYYNGLERFPRWSSSNDDGNSKNKNKNINRGNGGNGGNGSRSYVMVDQEEDEANINGEKVEMEMSREKKVQGIRALISGIGFVMGVVGIWGDGA